MPKVMTCHDDEVRTIIDLPQEQIEALDDYRKSKGISRAQAVREAVAAYLPPPKGKIDFFKHPAFDSWSGPKVDSVKYVKKLRVEWDHRS